MTRSVRNVVGPSRVAPPRSHRRESIVAAALLFANVAALGVLVDQPAGGVWTIDLDASGSVHRWALRHPDVAATAHVLAVLGGPLVINLAVLVVAVGAIFFGRYRAAVTLVGVRCGELLTKTALNDIVDRARPELQPALAHPAGTSFPSGHAAGTATVVGTGLVLLARARRSHLAPFAGLPRHAVIAVTTAGAVFIVAVAASRVVLGVHYPSDVLAGVLLGLAWTFAAEAFLARRPPGLRAARPSRTRRRSNPRTGSGVLDRARRVDGPATAGIDAPVPIRGRADQR